MKTCESPRLANIVPWISAGIVMLLLLVWEIASRDSDRVAFLFSRPSQIWDALVAMTMSGTLLRDTSVTASEALIGTVVGTVLGSAAGLALWLSKRAMRVVAPFVVIAANFPVFALAPAAIIWLGIGMSMKVFLAAFATFFVSLNLAHQGAKLAQERYGGVFDGFKASHWDTYRKIIVPGALDAVFSSMRVNVGIGILGAFIGEFIASEDGLGRAIIRASGLYQIDRVFAASLCIIVLAGAFDRLADGIQREKLLIARAFGLPSLLRARTKIQATRRDKNRKYPRQADDQ
jgi:NitT/TauT family transport system permease protein